VKRTELRRQARVAQRAKVMSLVVIAVLLLGAIPIYLFVRTVTQDPVFNALDSLGLPTWAAGPHTDAYTGSRLCIKECRFRERTWQSERPPDETHLAYATALTDAGWRARTEGACPAYAEGIPSCWHKDEYVLDMWVRAPVCDEPPARPTSTPAAGQTVPATPRCPGSYVTVKVFNAVSYDPSEAG
jgi:integrin beta 3